MKAPRNPWCAEVWRYMLSTGYELDTKSVEALFGRPLGRTYASRVMAEAVNAGWFKVIRKDPNVYVAKVPGVDEHTKWRQLAEMPRVKSIFDLVPV